MRSYSFLRGSRGAMAWQVVAYADPASRWRFGREAFADYDGGGWRGLQFGWWFVGLSWGAPDDAPRPA